MDNPVKNLLRLIRKNRAVEVCLHLDKHRELIENHASEILEAACKSNYDDPTILIILFEEYNLNRSNVTEALFDKCLFKHHYEKTKVLISGYTYDMKNAPVKDLEALQIILKLYPEYPDNIINMHTFFRVVCRFLGDTAPTNSKCNRLFDVLMSFSKVECYRKMIASHLFLFKRNSFLREVLTVMDKDNFPMKDMISCKNVEVINIILETCPWIGEMRTEINRVIRSGNIVLFNSLLTHVPDLQIGFEEAFTGGLDNLVFTRILLERYPETDVQSLCDTSTYKWNENAKTLVPNLTIIRKYTYIRFPEMRLCTPFMNYPEYDDDSLIERLQNISS